MNAAFSKVTRFFVLTAFATATPLMADEVVLNPVRDASIGTQYFQVVDNLCSNAGSYIFVGGTMINGSRRGLVAFDIAGNVPAGATIDAVELTLNCSISPNNGIDIPIGLHPLTSDWGEGTSSSDGLNGGGGLASATPGDATWVHGFFPDTNWLLPGGDFLPVPSATLNVGNALTDYIWSSTPLLVADVQNWLDDPASNFGWMLLMPGDDQPTFEAMARRFNSRENSEAGTRPRLRVRFTPVSTGCAGDLGDANGDGSVDGGDIQAFVECALSLALPTVPCECADINEDATVDVNDIALFAQLLLTSP